MKEINKLPSERRQRHKFDSHMDSGNIRTFIVDWHKDDNPNNRSDGNVRFTENCTSITFQQTNGKPVSIVPKWNENETRCDLYVGGKKCEMKKCEMWEISQMALGHFFFGTIGQ